MDAKKTLEAMDVYRGYFQRNNIKRQKFLSANLGHSRDELLEHCHAILDEMEDFVAKGNFEKASHWLGFIQGVLCAVGIYTLDQLKGHNRPQEIVAP